jgi:hypothetical protein
MRAVPFAIVWAVLLNPVSSFNTTFNETIFDGFAECALNEACLGLADDCCPTMDGVYLCKSLVVS